MPRSRFHPDRVSIELAVGGSSLALGGILLGFFVVAPHHWQRGADFVLLLFGVLSLALGVYVFLQFYVSWLPPLPPPKVRRPKIEPAPLAPELASLLDFMSPRGKINSLITEGENIRKYMPRFDGTSPLAALLGGGPDPALRTYKQVAGWEERAAEQVRTLAPSYTSLFTTDALPILTSTSISAHMAARLDELKEILKKL